MFGSIQYNLAHLLDFRGRDARQTFWYYVLFLVILRIIVAIGVSIPMIGGVMSQAMDAARSGVTDQQALTASMLGSIGPWLHTAALISIVAGLVTTLLLLASFVRRAHDSGNSGWWVALPLAAELFDLGLRYQNLSRIGQVLDQAAQQVQSGGAMNFTGQSSALGMIGWIAPLVLLVFGVMKSTDGPNRYGDEPVRF